MKDYASMSDQQINQLVGAIVSRDGLSIIAYSGNAVIHEYSDCGDFKGICLGWKVFDPCNNPADAWPILLENDISLHFNYEEWDTCTAHAGREEMLEYEFSTFHANPLRAAMVVFLMMKEGE